ncbi:protein phosphatase 2C and cyclic nucleotide-binding/kinase domain-containing protein-like isoform X2 [Papaver somniferum]|uniref:protein phosphatase 2C and cyclic nucleotide-binding/kinase domain-containing protein-like isoform X2 n=1 Tax=Papaver somniferum TaxID=3469 RepID=UPI000E701911|nr:protein phosphatase 2C and cyclic nucleotide-binding/kinase domain-containing protein-like isoform X2 [Papaver somniferum]
MGCWISRDCIGQIPNSSSPGNSRSKGVTGNGRRANNNLGSDSDEEGESEDQFNQLSTNNDSEVGITRLSRVSSQFLPPDGSRTVKVPSENYDLKYSYLSQRGFYPEALDKANQDSFCIHTPFGTNPDDHFFGVFDGHGEFGAQCSQFTKRKVCENLLRNGRFHMDAVEACHSAFLATNTQLHEDTIDDTMSGTTAITILVRGRTIYVANAGDSRAVIAETRGKDIVAVDLSIDQTPFRTDELERVKLYGARVLTLDQIEGLKNPDIKCWGTEESDDGDPPRLWVQNGMYPGTAFTRSIGDSVAESIGVVATPEIVVLELTPENPFFVIASDGVFEFLSSQSVVDMVAKFKDPRDACAAIVAESYRLWLQYETRTDDITIIVVHINGLTDNIVVQPATPDVAVRPLPQVVEMTGSESPSTINWNSRNPRERHELSRTRLRAIESSLENGQVWVPPSPLHRKTWEEESHIERALRDHFLFKKLTDAQCHVLLDCMQRVEFQPGDVVVQQGGEGDCFFIVGSGEFEVFATQEEKNEEVPRVLQRYTAEKLSSFGELALMYNKPLQASIRAVTNGILWALRREDFRGILMSEFSTFSSLKLLRSVELFSRLSILQLSQLANSLSEVSFPNGQTIIDEVECLSAFYIIKKGQVKITCGSDVIKSSSFASLLSDNVKQENDRLNDEEFSVEKNEGSYFGEWVLLDEKVISLSATAVGDVICLVITKEKFESAIGPLAKLSQNDRKSKDYTLSSSMNSAIDIDPSVLAKVQLSDLEWRTCTYSTDCGEIGLVLLRGSGLQTYG